MWKYHLSLSKVQYLLEMKIEEGEAQMLSVAVRKEIKPPEACISYTKDYALPGYINHARALGLQWTRK